MQKKDMSDIRDDISSAYCPDLRRQPQGQANNSQVAFGSNSVRLSPGEWLVAAVIFAFLFCLSPMLWKRLEKFAPGAPVAEPDPDYRVQYNLTSDYWHFRRYCRWACSRYDTLVVGDSVIWGHYVPKNNTLSHYLNERAGQRKFANLGLDGTCPVVLEGLLRYHARDITRKKVILHFNPLWLSSPRHDLQTEKEHRFNHAELAPQFFSAVPFCRLFPKQMPPKIPCYRATCSERISAVIRRYVPFLSWTAHLNIAYFQSPGVPDIPSWTLVHPYENPLRPLTLGLPASDEYEKCRRISRPAQSRAKSTLDWVELQTSVQWRFFLRSIELLKERGNTVFVLVGPFNEHILEPQNVETYTRLKARIETYLAYNNILHYAPPVLPPEFYCDASHPLSPGYAELANQLFENQSFKSAILNPAVRSNRPERPDR